MVSSKMEIGPSQLKKEHPLERVQWFRYLGWNTQEYLKTLASIELFEPLKLSTL